MTASEQCRGQHQEAATAGARGMGEPTGRDRTHCVVTRDSPIVTRLRTGRKRSDRAGARRFVRGRSRQTEAMPEASSRLGGDEIVQIRPSSATRRHFLTGSKTAKMIKTAVTRRWLEKPCGSAAPSIVEGASSTFWANAEWRSASFQRGRYGCFSRSASCDLVCTYSSAPGRWMAVSRTFAALRRRFSPFIFQLSSLPGPPLGMLTGFGVLRNVSDRSLPVLESPDVTSILGN